MLNPIPPKQGDASGLFIFMDGDAHGRFRRMLTAEFMIKNIRRIEPLIEETVVEALERMRALGAPADLMSEFALPVPSMTICHLLGVPYSDHDFFQHHSRVIMDRNSGPAEVDEALGALAGLLGGLVKAKRTAPTDDLLSRLVIERVVPGELREDELVSLAMLLLVAGHETTANMIGLSALVLLEHPERLDALREDPSLASGMVEELLRYLTVVRTGCPASPRRTPRSADRRSARARVSWRCWRWPTGTARSSVILSCSTRRGARRTGTWRSASACTSASASRWPGPSSGWLSSSWPAASPDCGPRERWPMSRSAPWR